MARADLRQLGAIYTRLRKIAARQNLPWMGRVAEHLKRAIHEHRSLPDAPPIGQCEADRRMRKLEVPLHADAAVFYIPVRHLFLGKAEIDMVGVAGTGGCTPTAQSGVEQAVI